MDAYWEANIDLIHVTPELNLYDEDWPIWTFQEQLPPAKFVFDDEGRRGMAVDSLVSGGCIISGSTVRRSLLFSNVRVHSFCNIEDSVILPDVEINRHVQAAPLRRRQALRAARGLHGRLRSRAGPQALPRHRARHHADHARDARPEGLHHALMTANATVAAGAAVAHAPAGFPRLQPPANSRQPWVYLHAIKDYTDMAAHLENHPGVHAVVNLVPILLDQLEDYADQFATGKLRDPLLRLLARENLDDAHRRRARADPESVLPRQPHQDDRAVSRRTSGCAICFSTSCRSRAIRRAICPANTSPTC